MKKIIFVLSVFIGLVVSAAVQPDRSTKSYFMASMVPAEKYAECIRACNEAMYACNLCIKSCSGNQSPKSIKCIQYCKECISICKSSVQLMQLNSQQVKDICSLCSKICEKCADACKVMDMKVCTECATACLKAAGLCKDVQM